MESEKFACASAQRATSAWGIGASPEELDITGAAGQQLRETRGGGFELPVVLGFAHLGFVPGEHLRGRGGEMPRIFSPKRPEMRLEKCPATPV